MPDKTILTAMRRMLAMTDADPSFILPHSIENYGGTSRTECLWYPFNDPENEAKIGASVRPDSRRLRGRSVMEQWNEAVLEVIKDTEDQEWRNFLRGLLF